MLNDFGTRVFVISDRLPTCVGEFRETAALLSHKHYNMRIYYCVHYTNLLVKIRFPREMHCELVLYCNARIIYTTSSLFFPLFHPRTAVFNETRIRHNTHTHTPIIYTGSPVVNPLRAIRPSPLIFGIKCVT